MSRSRVDPRRAATGAVTGEEFIGTSLMVEPSELSRAALGLQAAFIDAAASVGSNEMPFGPASDEHYPAVRRVRSVSGGH